MVLAESHRTITDLLRYRASREPNQVAYRFLSEDGNHCSEISYRELDEQARRAGAWLQSRCLSGTPIPLIFPAGLDFIRAFYGCLYSGNFAVPLTLPNLPGGANRLFAILADLQPVLVVAANSVVARLRRNLEEQRDFRAFEVASFTEIDGAGLQLCECTSNLDQLALLQYTSGSTSSPKGVEISHANLLHNIELIARVSGASAESIGVSWLPHFHDMGLIGGILMPLCVGFPVTLMSPTSFMRRPVRWLETISRTRATISGAPNFGYEHCLREIGDDDLRLIDLSSWRTAVAGAEPIRAETIQKFSLRFEELGFKRNAFFPCYGLAEATLIVSGQYWNGLSERKFSRRSLERGCAREAIDDGDAITLVSSGPVLEGHEVLIMDPVTAGRCDSGTVGEVWVRSKSVGRGYWKRLEDSRKVFGAYPRDVPERFLRTGDLGFLWRGQLFITGRLKDLLIIRGANFFPQDIERTLEGSVPALRAGFGAAFTVDDGREEKLVIAYELDKNAILQPQAQFASILSTLIREFGLQPHAIVLVKRNRIPRTTSGKIRRQQCRADFVAGGLAVIAEWRNLAGAKRTGDGAVSPDAPLSQEIVPAEEVVKAAFKGHAAELLGVGVEAITDECSIYELGIDSLIAGQLQNRIERSLGLRFELTKMMEAGTVREIIVELARQARQGGRTPAENMVDSILETVMRLPDEEVARLLSAEESRSSGGQP